MNEKERLKKALHHEKTDRPPCICPGGMMNMITTDLMDRSGITLAGSTSECRDDGGISAAGQL